MYCNTESQAIESFFEANVATGTIVMIDKHGGYIDLPTLGYEYYSFNYSKGEYTHTNQIEKLWEQ